MTLKGNPSVFDTQEFDAAPDPEPIAHDFFTEFNKALERTPIAVEKAELYSHLDFTGRPTHVIKSEADFIRASRRGNKRTLHDFPVIQDPTSEGTR